MRPPSACAPGVAETTRVARCASVRPRISSASRSIGSPLRSPRRQPPRERGDLFGVGRGQRSAVGALDEAGDRRHALDVAERITRELRRLRRVGGGGQEARLVVGHLTGQLLAADDRQRQGEHGPDQDDAPGMMGDPVAETVEHGGPSSPVSISASIVRRGRRTAIGAGEEPGSSFRRNRPPPRAPRLLRVIDRLRHAAAAHPRRTDVAIALLLFAASVVSGLLTGVDREASVAPGTTWPQVPLLALMTLPLIWRRDRPLTVMLTIVAGTVGTGLFGFSTGAAAFAIVLALASASYYRGRTDDGRRQHRGVGDDRRRCTSASPRRRSRPPRPPSPSTSP